MKVIDLHLFKVLLFLYYVDNHIIKDMEINTYFRNAQDPMGSVNQLHQLVDILLMGIISVVC
jgi:hypothetical protein